MSNGSTPRMKPTQLTNAVAVELIGVNKWYGEFHVLRDINLKVMRGERIVICGPSGSGKSTMIRCINRLEEHQQGQIVVDGIELDQRPQEDRRSAPRGRHGVPALQPVSASHRAGELHAGADLGAQDAEEGGRRNRDALSRARQDPGAGRQISRPALRRPAAARRDRARAVHEPEDHAVRRADLGARSGNGQGGARHHGGPRRGRHDHAGGDPRNGLRPPGRQPHRVHGRRARSSR